MNPSYCRIRVPKDDAVYRFAKWNHIPQIPEQVETNSSKALELAVDDRGQWKGNAVFVSVVGEWTLFQDFSGCLSAIPAQSWLKFADPDELVFAGYNDAIGYGELIVIKDGRILREFLYDEQSSSANTDKGDLGAEYEPLKSWIEVASFVDEDEFGFSDKGWLWVF